MYELPVVDSSCSCRLRHSAAGQVFAWGLSQRFSPVSSVNTPMVLPPPEPGRRAPGVARGEGSRPRTMQPTLRSRCSEAAPWPPALLLSPLLPELSGPSAGRPPGSAGRARPPARGARGRAPGRLASSPPGRSACGRAPGLVAAAREPRAAMARPGRGRLPTTLAGRRGLARRAASWP